MPDSYEREVHFYHMYVLDLFGKMETYDVRCLVEYDRFLRQRMAAGFIETWNPDLLHPTWMRFIQGRTESGQPTSKSGGKQRVEKTSPSPKTASKIHCCYQ
ncbi:hypothetical protein CYMTET_15281 [Cymbomonas tetramitiformis]|uniref:Uncharacterized protein n=1 Tax=Cymbomonas tetramitiformis TaxID=36881 RepID=A0AAE0GEK5_9CHLO|nr:hypothetical protein CYMTET_15281 [Cymbomonas tetramitiformis]